MHWRSVVIWSLAAAGVVWLYFSLFPSFSADAALVNEALARFPPEFRAAFGLGEVDFSTVMGFFSFVYLFLQILLAIQAANYGFGLVSVEERELTADFLLTRPVTRSQIMTSKLLAALAGLAITANNALRFVAYVPFGIFSVVFIVAVWGRKTWYPRWFVLFCPVFPFMVSGRIVENLEGRLKTIVGGGYLNLLLLAFFLASTLVLARRRGSRRNGD